MATFQLAEDGDKVGEKERARTRARAREGSVDKRDNDKVVDEVPRMAL